MVYLFEVPRERVTESIARAFFSVQEGKVIPLQGLEIGKKRGESEGKRRRFLRRAAQMEVRWIDPCAVPPRFHPRSLLFEGPATKAMRFSFSKLDHPADVYTNCRRFLLNIPQTLSLVFASRIQESDRCF